MSQKYNLVQDRDDDSPSGSIQRHLSVAGWMVAVPIMAVVVLSIFYGLGVAKQANLRKVEQAATATQRAVYAMTKTAMPNFAPHATTTPLPSPTIQHQTLLRAGPGLEFGTLGSINKHERVTLIGRDATGDWYLLINRAWVAASAVSGAIPDLPLVSHE